MTSSPHGLYAQGCTRATMARTKGREAARRSQSQKARPSSDRRLQLASVKSESLVIAGQQHRGECVPEPCTHRPSSHERSERPKTPSPAATGRRSIGTKSKQGNRRGTCGWIPSFLRMIRARGFTPPARQIMSHAHAPAYPSATEPKVAPPASKPAGLFLLRL